MKFKTLSGIEYQIDESDAMLFVGVPIRLCSNGYLSTMSCHWDGDRYIHRVIMGAGDGEIVDHISGDKLDNRRINLRICNDLQNSFNARLRSNNKTGVRGVYWDKSRMKWSVQITAGAKTISLGRFVDFDEACQVRAEAERKLHGEFAALDGVLKEAI